MEVRERVLETAPTWHWGPAALDPPRRRWRVRLRCRRAWLLHPAARLRGRRRRRDPASPTPAEARWRRTMAPCLALHGRPPAAPPQSGRPEPPRPRARRV